MYRLNNLINAQGSILDENVSLREGLVISFFPVLSTFLSAHKASSVQVIQSNNTSPTTFQPPTATTTHLHLVISYTAVPYAVKGSVAANRVAADGCCLMTAKDKFHQLPKQASKEGRKQAGWGRGETETGEKNRKQVLCCQFWYQVNTAAVLSISIPILLLLTHKASLCNGDQCVMTYEMNRQ